MSIQFSLNRFPKDSDLKYNSGLPWGCVVQPFVPIDNVSEFTHAADVTAAEVDRCEECFAYINAFARFSRDGWWCPICHNMNSIKPRYASFKTRKNLPEFQRGVIEFDVPDDEESNDQPIQPVFIAMVDLTGSYEALELIKSGLLGALEALPPSSLFGLVTFGNRLGVYDLKSPVPHVRHISIPGFGENSLGMDELVPLANFLVKISDFSDNVSGAIDSLRSVRPPQTGPEQPADPPRGFGSAVKSLIDFLDLFEESLTNVRVMAFLCGRPNLGLGKVEQENLGPSVTFFQNQGKRAAKVGACVDLFVITRDYVGLCALSSLTLLTGGNVMLYDDFDSASLPQDMYRQFSRPQASHGLFRLRTSVGFKVSNAYGHFHADPNFENLYHIEGCDQFKCFAFDFEFSGPEGGSLRSKTPPTMQLAFAYTHLPSVKEDESARAQIRRKLRVQTIQLEVSKDRMTLYENADPNVVLCLLTHKLIKACLEDGPEEGPLLLQDWLTIFLTHYNEQLDEEYRRTQRKNSVLYPTPRQLDIDLSLSKSPNLKKLLRYVFALHKSLLLSRDGASNDFVTYLQCLFTGLEPRFLQRALYPELSSYGAPNNLSSTNLPLARSSVASSRLFLLDAYTTICLYYIPEHSATGFVSAPISSSSATSSASDDASAPSTSSPASSASSAPEPMVFPPPKTSLIRTTIDALKQERHITPRVVLAKAGTPEELVFLSLLVEEGSPETGPSYSEYLRTITTQVEAMRATTT